MSEDVIVIKIEKDLEGPLYLNGKGLDVSFEISKIAELSASEALYGFNEWLLSRPESVPVLSLEGAIAAFCAANDFAEPRKGWHKILVHPREAERTPGFPTISESFVEQNRLEEIE